MLKPYFHNLCATLCLLLIMACAVKEEGKKEHVENNSSTLVFEREMLQIVDNGEDLTFLMPGAKSELVFSQPIDRIALSSTTQLEYFKELGALNKVVGCPWLQFVEDSEVQTQVASGQLSDISSGGLIDIELLLMASPEVFLYDPRESDLVARVSSQGIACIPFVEYQEQSAVDRVEWLKVVGSLLGLDELAIDSIRAIEDRYSLSIKPKLDSSKVLIVSYYQGVWSASGPGSLLADIVRDTGADYALSGSESGSVDLDIEEFIIALEQVSHLGFIHHGSVDKDKLLSWDDRLSQSKLNELSLFSVNTEEVPYFSKGILEPDLILRDLSAILEGANPKFVYFKPLGN